MKLPNCCNLPTGWLEYFTDGPNATLFASPIQDEANLVTPTICFFEVFKKVLLEFGEERALEAAGVMSRGATLEPSREIAIEAAYLSASLKLAMADSLILATAQAQAATLWTQDAHFAGLPGVRYYKKSA